MAPGGWKREQTYFLVWCEHGPSFTAWQAWKGPETTCDRGDRIQRRLAPDTPELSRL